MRTSDCSSYMCSAALEKWLWMAQAIGKQALAPQAFAQSARMAEETLQLWQSVFARFAPSEDGAADAAPPLPRQDRRFADPALPEHPGFALLHQTYLMLAEFFMLSARHADAIAPATKHTLEFWVNSLVDG